MNPSAENTSLLTSLEELCGVGDDDKFYTVSDDVFNYYANGRGNTTMTGPASSSSTIASHYGFNLNLSALQQNNNHPSPRRDLDEHQIYSSLSPGRDESRYLVDSYYGNSQHDLAPKSRHGSEGSSTTGGGFYSSPREHTPREISPRGQETTENYYVGNDSTGDRDLLREATGYSQRREDASSYYGRAGRDDGSGYYSPRDQPAPSHGNKPSPRDSYFPERQVGGDPPAFYPASSSREGPRDQSYRRDSSDSIFYPSPRDSLSPREGGYYGGSRELTPREKLIRNSAESYSDKSLPNPYAAPFVPQRSVPPPSSSVYGAPTLQFIPPYMNSTHRQQQPSASTVQGGGGGGVPLSIPYDFLQRSYRPQYEGAGGHGMMGPPQLQHSLPYQPVDPITGGGAGGGGGAPQRPVNVPPLSFSGMSSSDYANSTDSDEATPPPTGYYSPKYPVQRSFSGQQQQQRPPSGHMSSSHHIGGGNGPRPSPMLKSHSEKHFDLRRGTVSQSPQSQSQAQQTFHSTRPLNFNNRSTHTSSTAGNLSGRGKYPSYEEEDKSVYYSSISPSQHQLLHHHSFHLAPPPPPPPLFPLKILSIDVNGSFNATDEAYTFARNGFFDYIEESKAQVILMYNTGLENEDQLKIVRNEVKAKYNTESAMWASFKCPGPDGGRGVGVLVLGPLAPRTGWIVSDSCGHVLSASSRVKPGLPVLCFIACDCYIPPLEPTPFESMQLESLSTTSDPTSPFSFLSSPGEAERKDKVFQKVKEIIQGEHEKGVFVFAAGQIISNITRQENDRAANETFFKENGLVQMPVRSVNMPSSASVDTTSSSPVIATDNGASSSGMYSKNKAMSVDDVLVTYQPYGDGPRSPDGTGMKVLSTDALEAKVASPHYPTLIQVAIYGWPSETFLFSPKCDTPLSSGRKSRRNKSGRKKDDHLSPQLHQLSLSPRHQEASVSPPYLNSLTSASTSHSNLVMSAMHMPVSTSHTSPRDNYPPSSSSAPSSSSLASYHLLKNTILDFQTRLNETLHSTAWGVVLLDQMKYLLLELFRWIERINHQLDHAGYPTKQSIYALQEIYGYHADQFLRTAPEMMTKIFQNWLQNVEGVINAASACSTPPPGVTVTVTTTAPPAVTAVPTPPRPTSGR